MWSTLFIFLGLVLLAGVSLFFADVNEDRTGLATLLFLLFMVATGMASIVASNWVVSLYDVKTLLMYFFVAIVVLLSAVLIGIVYVVMLMIFG